MGVIVFEEAVFSDELAFFLKDFGDFIAGETFLADKDAGEDVFSFVQSETAGRLEEAFPAGCVEIDADVFEAANVGDDFFEEVGEVGGGWERQVQDSDFLFNFDRDFEDGRNEDDGFETVFEVKCDFLELSDGGVLIWVVPGEKGMQVLEEENGRIDLFDDLIERGEGIARGGGAVFLELDGGAAGTTGAGGKQAGGAAPFVNGFLAALGDLKEKLVNALFLRGNDVNDGVARADERLEFLGKLSGHSASMRCGGVGFNPINNAGRRSRTILSCAQGTNQNWQLLMKGRRPGS